MNDANNVNPPCKPDISEEMLSRWQTIVDLLARIVGVPAELIMKLDPPQIEVLVASATEGNPYKQGERADLNTGLYCEAVMAQRSPLLVPDALEDPDWDHNPDIKLGMISYLGFPLQWPDGEVFGTICVLDSKENQYSKTYVDLMSQFKELVEAQLGLLYAREHLEDLVEERSAELKDAKEQLQQNLAETEQGKLALEESEERFRNFMNNSPTVAYIKNEAGQHIYGNRTLFEKFQRSPEQFVGTTTHDFFPQIIANKIEAYDEAVRTKGVPVETDDWSDKWQGQVRWWKEIKFPLAGPAGEKLVGGIAFDITERKQAEEKLQKAFEEIKELKNRLEQENIYLREEIEVRHRHEEIIGKSDAIKKALNQAEQVADTDSTVLILGETGTGKELLARTITSVRAKADPW